jgi:hypothetical protein
MFASARRIAAILHNPPGALKPVHCDSMSTRFARNVDCEARAAIEAPATTMLIACAIVTMPVYVTPQQRIKRIYREKEEVSDISAHLIVCEVLQMLQGLSRYRGTEVTTPVPEKMR